MSVGPQGRERDDDRVILGRAAQYGLRLVQRPAASGAPVFEWRWIESDEPSPTFENRRLALDYMSDFLDGPTPAEGLVLPPVRQMPGGGARDEGASDQSGDDAE